MSRLGFVVTANRFFHSNIHPKKGPEWNQNVSVLLSVKCQLFAVVMHYPAQTHITITSHPVSPALPSPPLCLAVYLGLCGSDCGAPLQEFGSGRGLESRPTLSPIQRPARCEVGKFHAAIQVQWPPQRRLQAPAHSCRDLGAAQVRGGPG